MVSTGTFGYIIGKKKRMMTVDYDANLLWQVLVREIYILMKHFKNMNNLKQAFEKISVLKSYPRAADIKKCLMFTKLDSMNENSEEIKNSCNDLLYFCQGSFINILECGYILKQDEEAIGYTFILDFNKSNVKFYTKDLKGKIMNLNNASIEEIMEFTDMPTKTYTEIISNMKINFTKFHNKYILLDEELDKLENLKNNAKQQGAFNIEEKLDKLISNVNWELKSLHMERRVFYHRLKDLDLFDEDN